MGAKAFAVFMLVLAVIGLLTFGLLDKSEEAIAIGDPAPSPELTDLQTGERASIEDYRGQWVLLNFWSSWCEPCREESPDLQTFQDDNPEVVVVGINLEDASGSAKAFVSDLGLTYPQLRATDSRALRESYGSVARPENFLIDPEGNIAVIQRGPVTTEVLDEKFAPAVSQ